MRISDYIINVPLPESASVVLIHGYTGAIDVVTADFWERLSMFDVQTDTFSPDITELLLSRGYLTTKSREEEVTHVIHFADILHKKAKLLSYSFVFLVAYDCNFRCPYCYESNVLRGLRKLTSNRFTTEMIDKAYDAIDKIIPDSRLTPKTIMLYGGEPLMQSNREIIEYIVDKGTERGVKFFAVTNGYDLNLFEHLLAPDKIFHLQITVDGMAERHDKRRIHYKDGGSFDRIIANIGIALDKGVNVGLRMNVDKTNYDDASKLNEYLSSSGYFTKKGKLSIYLAPLHNYSDRGGNPDMSYFTIDEFAEVNRRQKYMLPCDVSMKASEIVSAIRRKRPLRYASTACSAQNGSYIFDPFGNLYSCWNEVGDDTRVIGRYDSSDIAWTSYKDTWHRQNIASSEKCRKCIYALLCHGGCMSHSEQSTGILSPGYCNGFPEKIKDAVVLAMEQLKNEKLL